MLSSLLLRKVFLRIDEIRESKNKDNENEKANHSLGKNICKHIFDKEFESRIYIELLQLNEKVGEIFTDTLPN